VKGDIGRFLMNVSTRYAPKLWLVEPRWATDRPGPLPLRPGDHARACDQDVRFVAPYPDVGRLWFVEGDLAGAMTRCGEPIRYGYVEGAQPLSSYQSMFATAPGSAEMPSAARPFTPKIVEALQRGGVGITSIRLHTGVSSIEVEEDNVEDHPIPPEPYRVTARTADAVNAAHAEGRRVIAIGTTVVRALESAWRDGAVHASEGFTRVVIHPDRGVNVVDGLLTGFHDPGASHLAMLYAVAGKDLVRDGYEEAVRGRYLWHEFGDSHLLLPR
jgi:S-adenosylmethionine:tRNA ribosyltransferase-isomerase